MTTIIRGSDNFDSAALVGKASPVNLTGSRAINTDYTNSGAGPRTVFVYGNNGTAGIVTEFSPNGGATWFIFGACQLPSGTAIAAGSFNVPAGGTYRVRSSSGTLSITQWWEQ